MTKRLLAMALALCMLLAMVPAVSAANVVVLDLSKDDYRLSVTGYWPGDAEEETPEMSAGSGCIKIVSWPLAVFSMS